MTLADYDIAAMIAHRGLVNSSHAVQDSVTQLSSGRRVNNAADDAASLAIGSRMQLETVELRSITQNLSAATSAVQIAEQGLSVIQNALTRMRALAVQAGSDHLSGTERAMLNVEFQALMTEIDREAKDTKFGKTSLLETIYAPIVFDSTFDSSTLPDQTYMWGGASTSVGGGAMTLLDGFDGSTEGLFASDQAFLTDSGLNVDFSFSARGDIDETSRLYGGGFSFFLVDGDTYDPSTSPAHPGGGSSNLGYRGLTGGFIGIGFDSFGAFANGGGGPGTTPQNISVRGSESMGWSYINGIDSTPFNGIDGADDDPNGPLGEGVYTRSVSLSLSEDFILNVAVTFEETGTTVQVVDNFDIGAVVTSRPETLKFGFAATTVGRRNNFLINDIDVSAQTDVVRRMDAAALNLRSHSSLPLAQHLTLPRFNATLEGLALNNDVNITTKSLADRAITRTDFAIEQVIRARAYLGATQNNYEQTLSNTENKAMLMDHAQSRLLDANAAAVAVDLVNHQTWRGVGINTLVESQSFKQRSAAALRAAQDNFQTGFSFDSL